MGAQLHRSEGPACSIITGGCPTGPGPASISTVRTILSANPDAKTWTIHVLLYSRTWILLEIHDRANRPICRAYSLVADRQRKEQYNLVRCGLD